MQTRCGFSNCNNPLPKEPFKIGYTIDGVQGHVIACAECGKLVMTDIYHDYSISPGPRLIARPVTPFTKPV